MLRHVCRVFASLFGFVVVASTLVSLDDSPAYGANTVGVIRVNQKLAAGMKLVAPRGIYRLTMQTDGDLVEYKGRNALWATGTSGQGNYATLEGDGNFAVMTSSGSVLWESGFAGTTGSYMMKVQSNGNITIFLVGSPFWTRESSLTDLVQNSLRAGQKITSPSGRYSMDMQADGNLVEYDGTTARWATGTAGVGNYARLGGDGNLVVYSSSGSTLWQTNDEGMAGSPTFDIQNDGNIVLYGSKGAFWARNSSLTSSWASSTLNAGQGINSPNGQYRLDMQADGNLVEYGPSGPLWASNTDGIGGGNYVRLGTDGNLIVDSGGGSALWQTSNEGFAGSPTFDIQNDGNIVLYGTDGHYWARSSNLTGSWASSTLNAGQNIASPSGQYTLDMQGDGNLVEYGPSGPLWWTSTTGSGNHVTMQADGNMVVYNSGGTALWCADQGGNSGAFALDLQNDSNLVVYNGTGVLWARTLSNGNSCGSAAHQTVVEAAESEIGQGYCLDGGGTGGASTCGFDCSGLSQYAIYKAFGITLPRTTEAQGSDYPQDGGSLISNQADLQPGDVVFFGGGSMANAEHVGIYVGENVGGQSGMTMVDANVAISPYPVGVQYRTLSWEEGGSGGLAFDGGVRY